MKMPCDQHIDCPCSELPLSNFSSEDPDRLIFLGRHYGFSTPPPPNNYKKGDEGCVSFSNSLIDQADGDWCALFALNECEAQENLDSPCWTCRGSTGMDFGLRSTQSTGDPCCDPDLPEECCCNAGPSDPKDPPPPPPPPGEDPPTPPPPGQKLYCNDPQTCTADCPDGGLPYTATVPACRFNATSKAMANRIAHSAACFEAEQFRICTDGNYGGGNPCKVVCVNGYFELQLNATSRADLGLSWSVTDGSLPNGVTMDGSGKISGTPATSGQSTSATVTITDESGHKQTREICFSVMDLSPDALPDGDCGAAYSGSVSASGGYVPYTFSLGGGTLPDGLTVNANGTITGTPTEKGDFLPIITVTDHLGNVCSKEMTLTILGITNNPYTIQVPCVTGAPSQSANVAAGQFCVATTTPNAQQVADAMALNKALRDTGALLAASGCTCYSTDPSQANPPDPASSLNLICQMQVYLDWMNAFNGTVNTRYGGFTGVAIGPGLVSFCDIFLLATGAPNCSPGFLVAGRMYQVDLASGAGCIMYYAS